jgi:hypothetical protein
MPRLAHLRKDPHTRFGIADDFLFGGVPLEFAAGDGGDVADPAVGADSFGSAADVVIPASDDEITGAWILFSTQYFVAISEVADGNTAVAERAGLE